MRVTMWRSVKSIVMAMLLTGARRRPAAWPERPVVLVVPFAAGGITDLLARITANACRPPSARLHRGEPARRPPGVVAADWVARAAPDGYTAAVHAGVPGPDGAVHPVIKFDPVKDSRRSRSSASSPFVITVGASVPARTLGESSPM